MPSSNDILPDKNYLYGEFQRGQRWRDRLAAKLAHKAVDIPEDEDVNLNVQNSHGTGWKELVAIAGLLFCGGWLAKNAFKPPAVPPAVPPAATSPADSEYEVRFYDAQGQLIEIPRLPKAAKEPPNERKPTE